MKPTTRRSAFSCLISPMTPSATWPGTRWVSIAAPAPFASALAASMTGAKRWFASSFSSAISSMLAGKRGSSSTVTIWSSDESFRASSIAPESAFCPPGDPSLATNIREYILTSLCGNDSRRISCGARQRLEVGLEPTLRDQGRYHCAADHRSQQDRVLALVDDVIGQPEERQYTILLTAVIGSAVVPSLIAQ